MSKVKVYLLLSLAAILAAGYYLAKPEFARPTYGLVLRQGENIRTALEQYMTDHQTYPANLEQLTPKYMEDIPKPKVYGRHPKQQWLSGIKWDYRSLESGQSYRLKTTGSGAFGFNNETEEWGFSPE